MLTKAASCSGKLLPNFLLKLFFGLEIICSDKPWKRRCWSSAVPNDGRSPNCQNSPGAKSLSILCHCERESQAISGWLRFHVQVTKNREITTFIFSVQASTLSSCIGLTASFNIDLYLYFTWKKIEDRNLEITLKKGQSTYCWIKRCRYVGRAYQSWHPI